MKQYNTNYRISLAYVLNTMLCLIFIFPMRMNGGTLLGELSLSNDFLSVGDINDLDVGVKRSFAPYDTGLLRALHSRNPQKHS